MPPVKSKYRNVKTVVGYERFDSKREADYWLGLKARQQNREIEDLRRQVRFALLTPSPDRQRFLVAAEYIADFTYREPDGTLHVVDAKGHRTALYQLKKKWLELQDGIVIEEV